MHSKRFVILISLDGWGVSIETEGNAIRNANTPYWDMLVRNFPYGTLEASGISVGLPWGEMGNSEVGHIGLGVGRVVYQSLPRISLAIEDESFFSNQALMNAANHAKQNGSSLHLIGLASPGGVHSHIEHLHALLQFARKQKIKKVYVHFIADGRDTDPNVAKNIMMTLEEGMKAWGVGEVATIVGRYFAMDRDNRWDRVQKAYDLMTKGVGEKSAVPHEAVEASYQKEISDEMIEPVVVTDKKGAPRGLIQPNDAVIFFNYREDRARELVKAFVQEDFDKFERGPRVQNLYFTTMTQYEEGLPADVAFPPKIITNCLAEVVSAYGKKQFHLAETEKYAHVTYFFNGGAEKAFFGEDRKVIASPSVPSYDQEPEMSAASLTAKILDLIEQGVYDFILVNFANPDIVGHTGNYEATVKACEFVDQQLQKIVEAAAPKNGVVMITADHGNAEKMIDPISGEVDKEHSINPVPLVVADPYLQRQKSEEEILEIESSQPLGLLADVAPTVLAILGIPQPPEMTGRSLLQDLR